MVVGHPNPFFWGNTDTFHKEQYMSDESANVSRKGQKKWWYPIGVFGILCVFFLGMDYATSGSITWSVWPVAAILFFGIGFSLLNKYGRE